MKISYLIKHFPFKYPFTISKGTKTHQPSFLIEIEFMGLRGYGEAPAIAYYNIPVEKMEADFLAKKNMLEKFTFTDPERFWHFCHHMFPNNSFLVCALDMAGWDLYGKLRNKPLYKFWQLDPSNAPLTDYTIGIDTPERMVKKLVEKPWPYYKIKVGFEDDLHTIQTLRERTLAPFRVDANAAWDKEIAFQKIKVLETMNVEFIEQPLAKDNWEGMKWLYQQNTILLFADESCVLESDVDRCADHFHGINIKLTKCSGITPARRMITKAKSLGLKIMLGCMNESTIGSAAIAQLAPMVDYVDNDGTLLLDEDIASGVEFDHGKFIYTDLNGLGIQLKNSSNFSELALQYD